MFQNQVSCHVGSILMHHNHPPDVNAVPKGRQYNSCCPRRYFFWQTLRQIVCILCEECNVGKKTFKDGKWSRRKSWFSTKKCMSLGTVQMHYFHILLPSCVFLCLLNTELFSFHAAWYILEQSLFTSDYKGIVVHCSNICVHTVCIIQKVTTHACLPQQP